MVLLSLKPAVFSCIPLRIPCASAILRGIELPGSTCDIDLQLRLQSLVTSQPGRTDVDHPSLFMSVRVSLLHSVFFHEYGELCVWCQSSSCIISSAERQLEVAAPSCEQANVKWPRCYLPQLPRAWCIALDPIVMDLDHPFGQTVHGLPFRWRHAQMTAHDISCQPRLPCRAIRCR